MQDRPTFGALSNQGLCHLCSVAKTTENLSEYKFTNKKQLFVLWRKHLSYNFHLWENAYHRVFMQFSVRMELYEIVWKEISRLWELYDKHFWSTRVKCQWKRFLKHYGLLRGVFFCQKSIVFGFFELVDTFPYYCTGKVKIKRGFWNIKSFSEM